MVTTAQRIKKIRARRRVERMHELRLLLPDVRLASVRRRLAKQASHLNQVAEADTQRWIEAVADPSASGNANRR
ncbi:MAG TPA: hypothetical protein VNF74_04060 [Terriglobales bacterium]|nr:hypothetical protein [Terriglobales bacterium]